MFPDVFVILVRNNGMESEPQRLVEALPTYELGTTVKIDGQLWCIDDVRHDFVRSRTVLRCKLAINPERN